MKLSPALLIIVTLLLARPSFASQDKIYRDDSGMPHCIETADGSDGVFFVSEGDLFAREIKTISFDEARARYDDDMDCEDWSLLNASDAAKATLLGAEQTTVGAFSIPLEMQEAFQELRRGATTFHPEKTGEEYLQNHPIPDFNRDLNRELSKKYGVGFVGEIYAAYVLHHSANNEMLAKLVDQKLAAGGQAAQDKLRFAHVTAVMANGFMQTPNGNRMKPVADMLESVGMHTALLQSLPMGGIDDNAALYATQLEKLIDASQAEDKFILLGASKSVVEFLESLNKLRADHPAALEKIISVIGICGNSDGSYLVDWFHGFPRQLILDGLVRYEAKSMGLPVDFTGLNDLRTNFFRLYYAGVIAALPKSIKYFNLIPVPGGNGLVRDADLAGLQKSLVRPLLSGFGANDGFLEFPGSAMPTDTGLDVYQMTLDASHGVMDGRYKGLDFNNLEERQRVLLALFDAAADILQL